MILTSGITTTNRSKFGIPFARGVCNWVNCQMPGGRNGGRADICLLIKPFGDRGGGRRGGAA